MINRRLKLRLISCLVLSALSLQAFSKEDAPRSTRGDKSAQGIEKKADKKYIRQEFDDAMKTYETATNVSTKDAMSSNYEATLNLKVARLYLTMLNYSASVPHFDKAISLNPDVLSTEDICNYLDALRFSGQRMRARIVARDYAYKETYRKDQRFLNVLHALDYEGGFMPVGVPEYTVKRLDNICTSHSDFWVGKINNEYFYATSNSNFHDPTKRFYHRTKYYSLNEDSEFSFRSQQSTQGRSKYSEAGTLSMIPADMQNGPLSMADDMSKLAATSISTKGGDRIKMTSAGLKAYSTKIYISQYNKRRNGWSKFKLAFPQQKEASYAHPFLFNGGQSMLFSSDMAGGFGGYDLYITHWDEKLQSWGDPVNLGSAINTEGDEITPTLYKNLMIFASNGQVGFGGHDLYSIFYENGSIVEGSLYHFDYPINTIMNDFGMTMTDKDTGYVISDRVAATKDDIYYFEKNKRFKVDNLVYGVSESDAISDGSINLVTNEGKHNKPRKEAIAEKTANTSYVNNNGGKGNANSNIVSYLDAELTPVSNVYFDFDKFNINSVAMQDLKKWLKDTDLSKIASIVIDGYTDELGSEGYNHRLSEQRAQTVATWLKQQGVKVPVQVHGRGQLVLLKEDLENSATPSISFGESKSVNSLLQRKIWMNRKARRVEIKVKMK